MNSMSTLDLDSLNMASRKTVKPLAVPSNNAHIGVNDKVYRLFVSHELPQHNKDQWIHGKITGFKQQVGKGNNRTKTIWWTLVFDPPATKPLLCDSDEVYIMKLAAEEYRSKKADLELHVGKMLVVEWLAEDADLSMTEWTSEYRVCVVFKFIVASGEFVLRFKCGYDKFVSADELIHLMRASDILNASTRSRVTKPVRIAHEEKFLVGVSKPTPIANAEDLLQQQQNVKQQNKHQE